MSFKQRLTALLPTGKKRRRLIIAGLFCMCLLLCGFSWTWVIEFTTRVIFPFEDAVNTDMILSVESVVSVDDLQLYMTDPLIAEQIVGGVQSNLSAHVYDNIQLPDMTMEPLGSKIIKIIFDRLFT